MLVQWQYILSPTSLPSSLIAEIDSFGYFSNSFLQITFSIYFHVVVYIKHVVHIYIPVYTIVNQCFYSCSRTQIKGHVLLWALYSYMYYKTYLDKLCYALQQHVQCPQNNRKLKFNATHGYFLRKQPKLLKIDFAIPYG